MLSALTVLSILQVGKLRQRADRLHFHPRNQLITGLYPKVTPEVDIKARAIIYGSLIQVFHSGSASLSLMLLVQYDL